MLSEGTLGAVWGPSLAVLPTRVPREPGCTASGLGPISTSTSILTGLCFVRAPRARFWFIASCVYVVGLTGAFGRPPVSGSSLLLCGSGSCRTVLAVAGKDFCVVASDTRLGLGYSIPSRKVSRILKMYVFFPLMDSGLLAKGPVAWCSAPRPFCPCFLGLEAHCAICALVFAWSFFVGLCSFLL